jgi:prepilin-type N-terminal cleavage/methylation domain-containing protein
MSTQDDGFTLVEVCIALTLLAITLSVVAQLFVVALVAQDGARVQSMTTVLASQKMEALRALVWTVDENGQPLSDRATDLSFDPATAGGSGLGASPVNALDVNTVGYVDFLDARGAWVGTGSSPPLRARYIRRWCIRPLPEDPSDAVVLQVLVTTVTTDRRAPTPRRRLPNDALVVTVRTRKAH